MYGITEEEIKQLISAIDYSEALTITASENVVREACEVALKYGFRAVVAFPHHLRVIVEMLKGTDVRTQIPVGFPCGGVTTKVKCTEAEEGLSLGANDLDMVMNISAFKEGNFKRVSKDILDILSVAKPFQIPFKVIIEVGVLTDQEIVTAAKLVADTGADFVKTCTGFGPGKATVHNITLIKETVGDQIKIKASGGVASIEDGVVFMRAGASVIAMRRNLIAQLEELKRTNRLKI